MTIGSVQGPILTPTEFAHLHTHMQNVLQAAQKHRPLRSKWIQGELEWVTYERGVMLAEVNTERAKYGKPPISVDTLRRQEGAACGHSDYTRKFALYCANLVVV